MLSKILKYWLSFLFSLTLLHAATWENLQSFKWPTCTIPQNIWRIGIGVGIEYANLEARIKDDFSAFGAVQFGDRDQTQKLFQISPSFEVGKTSYNDYYTGIIASWHYSRAKKESRAPLKHETYFTHQFKMSYYFNILAKLGYKVTPSMMPYILVGPSIAKWSHITDQITKQSLVDTFKTSQTSLGLGMGLGVEQVICKGVAVSLNYTHHFYKAKVARQYMHFTDKIGPADVPRDGIIRKKITPSSDAISLRLTYFF